MHVGGRMADGGICGRRRARSGPDIEHQPECGPLLAARHDLWRRRPVDIQAAGSAKLRPERPYLCHLHGRHIPEQRLTAVETEGRGREGARCVPDAPSRQRISRPNCCRGTALRRARRPGRTSRRTPRRRDPWPARRPCERRMASPCREARAAVAARRVYETLFRLRPR